MGKIFSGKNLWTTVGAAAGTVAALGLIPLTAGASAFALPHTLAGAGAIAGGGVLGGILGNQAGSLAEKKGSGGNSPASGFKGLDTSDDENESGPEVVEGNAVGLGRPAEEASNVDSLGTAQRGSFVGAGSRVFGFTRDGNNAGTTSLLGG